jgi:hypothetical protein
MRRIDPLADDELRAGCQNFGASRLAGLCGDEAEGDGAPIRMSPRSRSSPSTTDIVQPARMRSGTSLVTRMMASKPPSASSAASVTSSGSAAHAWIRT